MPWRRCWHRHEIGRLKGFSDGVFSIAITLLLHHADSVLVRLNLLLLLVISFIPFPTKLLGEFIHESEPERVAATVYGINLLLAMVMVSVVWRYAVHAQLVQPDLADEDVKTLTRRLTPTLGVYVVMILVGLFLPLVRCSATWRPRCSSSYRSAHFGISKAIPDAPVCPALGTHSSWQMSYSDSGMNRGRSGPSDRRRERAIPRIRETQRTHEATHR
jgi:uncharacterized membrane protein